MIYFAKPNGCGNGISIEHAGEFTDLIKKLKCGDTLYVLSGTYRYDKQITIIANSIKDKEISIIADDIENLPIFDFRFQPYGNPSSMDINGFRLFGEYLHINGMVVAYAGYKGIRSELSNSTLENIEIYGSCDSGIQFASGGNNKLINCISHDNFGYKLMNFQYINFGYNSDGISDKLHYGKPNTFINCKSYNNTDDGFDFFGRCTEEFTMLNNCESSNNGKNLFDMRNYPRYEIDKEWFEQFKYGKEMLTIDGKKYFVTLDNYPAFGNGNGFKLGGYRRYHCVKVENCIANYNKMKGFDQNNNSGVMKLFGCYAEGNKMYDFGFRNTEFGEVILDNCISKDNFVLIETKLNKVNNCSWC